jgi:hypothetical protein
VAAVLCAVLLGACGTGTDSSSADDADVRLALTVEQLRRDQVLERVSIGVRNRGTETVVLDRLDVRIPGFRSPGPVAKDSPVAPGTLVYLPWPYGEVQCPDGDGDPRTGDARVRLRLHTETEPRPREVRLTARDEDSLLQRIAARACTVRRVTREVELSFEDDWRPVQTSRGVELHGHLRATLRADEVREVTQVAGAILYGLRPDDSAGPAPEPLATVAPSSPEARIPVIAYAARCDGHTIGEIKKPYEFLVWVGAPEEEPVAVTPQVGDATKKALRLACAF